jgi:hypothetical protein
VTDSTYREGIPSEFRINAPVDPLNVDYGTNDDFTYGITSCISVGLQSLSHSGDNAFNALLNILFKISRISAKGSICLICLLAC